MGLDKSMFDRLVERGVEPILLDTQYRMHPALAVFPSEATYGGRIVSAVSKAMRPMIEGFPWPLENVPIAFWPVDDGCEYGVGTSHANDAEAKVVAEIINMFVQNGALKCSDIGVIS